MSVNLNRVKCVLKNILKECRMGNVSRAVALFKEGFSCSQAVCTAFCEGYGFEREKTLLISSAFGGGMGHNDEVCGAVAGALMVIGMKYGRVRADDRDAKEKCYSMAGVFFHRFKSLHGTVRCTDLLGVDISSTEGLQIARSKELFQTRCVDFVRHGAEILEEIL
jgi:C_GCAxxG_C_C family probable redox protein